MNDVSLLSVSFGNRAFIDCNVELTESLNAVKPSNWLVVNNGDDGDKIDSVHHSYMTPVKGIPKAGRYAQGSYHHAAALNLGLGLVKTRFLVVLDHDFYIIQQNWIQRVLEHMINHDLSFFGAPWNPFWNLHYRDFPAVHFMAIDLDRVDQSQIDFTPGFLNDWKWSILRFTPFQFGQFRDTGYSVARRFTRSPEHLTDLLIPHYKPPLMFNKATEIYCRLTQSFQKGMPEGMCALPKKTGYYTDKSFLEQYACEASNERWEEFFWFDQPFAFHLRQVGRRNFRTVSEAADLEKLKSIVRFHTL